MKIFWTKKALQDYVALDRYNFMDATARNAAIDAVHYYLCWRTLDWWREAIDKAEKQGSKYVSLAELVAVIQKENETRKAGAKQV